MQAIEAAHSPMGFAPAGSGRSASANGRFWRWLDRQFPVLAVIPTVLLMLIVFGIPLLVSLVLSFKGWTPDKSIFGGEFVGLANYQYLFEEPTFIHSLVLTVLYTIGTVAAELLFGLGVALLLNVDKPLMPFFRAVLIIPMMMTPIVAALCWKLLLDSEFGIVNWIIGQRIVWLGEPSLVPFSVAFVNVWQNTPYVAILLLAGLRAMPTEPREAAAIDGANRFQIFWHVTLPLLKPAIVVAMLLRVIFEFRSFDNVYVMTGGGPGDASMLLSVYTFIVTFVQFDFGLGASASWVMLAVSLLLCLAFVGLLRRKGAG
jgi:multiple sugar transport system permease protein